LAPGELDEIVGNLTCSDENLLIELDACEDAAVYKIDESRAIIQSVDIITPVVDDPYYYGQVAAANSLSDIFAMGAKVLTAMNVVGFDGCNHPRSVLNRMLEGAKSKVEECGGVTVGGHTIETPEMLFGLSVTGIADINKIYRNNTPRVGDVLILTKAIGMGVATTAIKADMLEENAVKRAVAQMVQLNYKASIAMQGFDVSACTDITGFGLLGHSYEMSANKVTIEFKKDEIPLFKEAIDLADMGIIPAGTYANKSYLADKVKFVCEEDILLFDAQTSGGLLIAVSQNDADKLLQMLISEGYDSSAIIGEVKEKEDFAIQVV